jgi:transmembrane 9 superfamily protein 2/4
VVLAGVTFLFVDILGKPLNLTFKRSYQQVAPDEPSIRSWRRCQGDVFRRPDHPLILSVLVGTGFSLLIEIATGLMLFCLGGKYALGLLFVFHSVFAAGNGFMTSQLYLLFHGTDWVSLTLASAFSVPTFLLGAIVTFVFSNTDSHLNHSWTWINTVSVFLILLLTNSMGVAVGAIQGFTGDKI